MNLVKLDKRLDEDIQQLEKHLDKYEILLAEAEELNSNYKSDIAHFLSEINRVKKESSSIIEEIKKYYLDALATSEVLEEMKEEFEQYVAQADKILQNKLAIFQKQNEDNLRNVETKIANKICDIEEANKVELFRIINSLSEQEKEMISSKDELTGFITNEVQKLIEKNLMFDKRLVSLDERLLEQKRESEAKISDEHSWIEKEIEGWSEQNENAHQEITGDLNKLLKEKYYLLDNQCKSITRKLYFFMATTGILFIVVLYLLLGR